MATHQVILHPHITRSVRARAFSSARLARMREIMQRRIASGLLPGLITLVHRHNETHVEALGKMAFDADAPMRRDTIFRLASMTKPITAVAAMTLVEECKLRLDDPVDTFLPELANRKVLRTPTSPLDDTVPAKRAITLRDLLLFQSGYGEVVFFGPSPIFEAQIAAKLPLSGGWPFAGTNDELMKRLGTLPLAFQPGERWAYHLSGEILGVLIARATGKTLGEFLRERIFEPLGMKDTGFVVPESQIDRFPPCYCTGRTTGKTEVQDPPRGIFSKPGFEGGAGGLVSTIDDMLAFGQMMLANGVYGHERILSRGAVEIMARDHLTPAQKSLSPFFPDFWNAAGWGLGLGVITKREGVGRSAGSFGWDGAFSTSFWVDPAEQMIGILMTQRSPETVRIPPVIDDFWTAAYQAIED